jgi:hypothetical protein
MRSGDPRHRLHRLNVQSPEIGLPGGGTGKRGEGPAFNVPGAPCPRDLPSAAGHAGHSVLRFHPWTLGPETLSRGVSSSRGAAAER